MKLTPAMVKMLEQASAGKSPVEGKNFVGKRKLNMRALQDAGYLNGHVLTDAGRYALSGATGIPH